jgi:hypothetical protein
MTPQRQEKKETGRLEAFTDGVFAVGITLLVPNIKTLKAADLMDGHTSLTGALLRNESLEHPRPSDNKLCFRANGSSQ